jgi:RNA polymerase sigma-70 factor (ECF subfamily)
MLNAMSGFEGAALAELPVLYRVARRMTRDADAAEDLVSQTLLRAATGWSGFDGRFPRSWFIRIMQNIYSREMGKMSAQAVQVPLEEGTASTGDVWHDLDTRLLSSNIVEELERIPEEYRLAVTLCDMEELSYEEAAMAMEVTIGTVRSRLYRGRQILRERLAGMFASPNGGRTTCE